MENLSEEAIAAVRDGTDVLVGLVVQYSFSVLGAIIILLVGWMAAKVLERWTSTALGRFRHIDATLQRFFAKTVRYVVLAFVFTTVLSQFGVQTTSIVAALGAAGLAIGLALQGTLQNVAAGIMLLVLRPFKVGELIEVGDIMGVIQEIGLFATELRTLDGLYILCPNSELWNQPITNFHRNTTRRVDVNVGIGYDDDPDRAIELLKEIVSQDDRVLAEPEPYYYVASLGDNSVAVEARVWTATPDFWATSNDLRRIVKRRFEAEGLSIPFPQRDIHIVSGGFPGSPDGTASFQPQRAAE